MSQSRIGEIAAAAAASLAMLTASVAVAEQARAVDRPSSHALLATHQIERANAAGVYVVECLRPDGTVRWRDEFHNTVATVGKNLALDTYLAGSAYTVVGPYLGLISSTSYSAISAADTMASHGGWLEAGNANTPTYTGNRKTAAWSAASAGSKALSSALSYAITGTGTIKGAFMLYGAAATNAVDGTVGTLYSAGLFTGGDRAVLNGDTVNVSYTASL